MWFTRKSAPLNPTIAPVSAAQASPQEEFRAMLFCDQSLNNLLKRVSGEALQNNPNAVGWWLLQSARDHMLARRPEDAAIALQEVLGLDLIETRMRLWAWSSLRKLGHSPNAKNGSVAQGVVIELPMPGGLDTLALYRDGSARYLSNAGKMIVWDIPDREIHASAQNLFKMATTLFSSLPEKTQHSLPSAGNAALTILAYSGATGVELPYPPKHDRIAQVMLAEAANVLSVMMTRSLTAPANPVAPH
jgi:hypothetical protein